MRPKSISELKRQARHAMHGRFSNMAVLFLSAFFLQNIIVSLPSALFDAPKNFFLFISQILLEVLLEALGAMITIGLSRSALQVVRGKQIGLGDLFFSFKNQPDHFLALELILTAVNTVAGIPGYIFVWMTTNSDMTLFAFTTITTALSGLATLVTFLVTLLFSMSEFMMLDDPTLTAKEALHYSARLIKGHATHYLVLNVSFIGYLILGFLSAMVGFLWVMPYILITQAYFYEDLCDMEEAKYLGEV